MLAERIRLGKSNERSGNPKNGTTMKKAHVHRTGKMCQMSIDSLPFGSIRPN
jgi:hypothetical protein